MGDFITLTCPSCGANLNVLPNTLSLKCESCGTEHIIRNEAGNVFIEGYARCPVCKRNDKVQKVTGLNDFPPPSKPENQLRQESFGCLRIGIILASLFFFAYGLSNGMRLGQGWISIIAVAVIVWIVWDWSQKQRNSIDEIRKKQEHIDSVEIPAWNGAMRKWNALYYCARDDCVFIPGQGISVASSQTYNFLYQIDPK